VESVQNLRRRLYDRKILGEVVMKAPMGVLGLMVVLVIACGTSSEASFYAPGTAIAITKVYLSAKDTPDGHNCQTLVLGKARLGATRWSEEYLGDHRWLVTVWAGNRSDNIGSSIKSGQIVFDSFDPSRVIAQWKLLESQSGVSPYMQHELMTPEDVNDPGSLNWNC